MFFKALPEAVGSIVCKKYGVTDEYSYHIKRSLVYFDDAVKSLGDVILIKKEKPERINEQEWKKTEEFFRSLIMKSDQGGSG